MIEINDKIIKKAIKKVNERLEKLRLEPKVVYNEEDLKEHGKILQKTKEEQIKITAILDEIENLKASHEIDKIKTLFLNNSIDCEYQEYFIKILMHRLIRQKDIFLLSIGFEEKWFDCVKWNESLSPSFMGKKTPLCIAIEESNLEVQKFLIEKGASLNNPYSQGEIDEEDTIKNYFQLYRKKLNEVNILIEFEKSFKEKEKIENLILECVCNKNVQIKKI